MKITQKKPVPASGGNGNGSRHGNGNGNGNGHGNGNGVLANGPARYDTGLHYDDGSRYYVAAVDTAPSAPVAKVKMDLLRRTDDNLVAYVTAHTTQITGNAAFPAPQPTPAVLAAALALFQTKLADAVVARDASKLATTQKDEAREALIDLMTARGAYVQLTSEGSASLIESTGLGVVSPPTPTGPLPPPTNLRAILGAVPGSMEVRWDAVPGARGYIVQCSPQVTPRDFAQIKNTSRSSLLLENLELGATLVFRIASQGGSTGQSPWSAELIRGVA